MLVLILKSYQHTTVYSTCTITYYSILYTHTMLCLDILSAPVHVPYYVLILCNYKILTVHQVLSALIVSYVCFQPFCTLNCECVK